MKAWLETSPQSSPLICSQISIESRAVLIGEASQPLAAADASSARIAVLGRLEFLRPRPDGRQLLRRSLPADGAD